MRSVIIPAAGLATRMKPLSRGVSKAMIPVNGRPLISYVIEHIFSDPKVSEVVIVENELLDISEFVSRVYPDKNIKCVIQPEKLGPLHAIACGFNALDYNKNDITIWLGDTICLSDFDYSQNFLAVHSVPDPHRWCLVDEEGNLYDKPTVEVPTDLALIGIYNFVDRTAFNKAIKAGMKKPGVGGEYQIAALLQAYEAEDMNLVETDEWYDCGELNTYYESKARLLQRTARSFNKISVDTFYGTVTKTAEGEEKIAKIEAEKQWFKGLNPDQSLFCPRILESDYGVLRMSLEPGIALNEVLVYDNLRKDIWHDIIRKILRVHHEVFLSKTDGMLNSDMAQLEAFEAYFLKTKKRLPSIFDVVGGDTEVENFLLNTGLELCLRPKWSACVHGDSHLGNIIYDPHSGNIKFVDPRGIFGTLVGNEGDLRYDIGKLLQDFYCGYAMIMANRYTRIGESVKIDWVPGTEELGEFMEKELENHGYNVRLMQKLAVMLLITAIPFHADDPERQKALFYRGKELIQLLK